VALVGCANAPPRQAYPPQQQGPGYNQASSFQGSPRYAPPYPGAEPRPAYQPAPYQAPYAQQPYAPPQYAPPQYAPPQHAPAPYAPQPTPPPVAQAAPLPPQVAPPPSRPLLAPLVGTLAWRAEIGVVMQELVANLSADNAAKVRGVPLVFDNNANDVNAFAGCDEKGAPYVAATEGLLEVIDAIAQTQAADELFGSHAYEAYAAQIAPELVKPHGAAPALPLTLIPTAQLLNPQRMSRAHELFDEIVAFTFGHELSHHYLGHTGCAIGAGSGPDPAALGRLFSNLVPGVNQVNETAADSAGAINVLDTGRARAPAYRWTERGGLSLLDFFGRMETAAGISPLNPIGFLQTHPHPAFRIPTVQLVARSWALQHPG